MKHVIGLKRTNHRLTQHVWQRKSVVLLMLVVLIIGVSVAACSSSSTQNPGSTATPAQTPINATQQLYMQVTSKQPDVSNALNGSDTSFFPEVVPNCTYSSGVYHVQESQHPHYTWCISQNTTLTNFAFQVQMTITSGDFGGVMFRIDNTVAKYYRFVVGQNGAYSLHVSTSLSAPEVLLLSGYPSAIKTGLGQMNTLTVIANGSTLSLYVNKQFVGSKSDVTLASGGIGLIAETTSSSSANVTFSNVQIWKL